MLAPEATGTGVEGKDQDPRKQHVCWQNVWLFRPDLLGASTDPPTHALLSMLEAPRSVLPDPQTWTRQTKTMDSQQDALVAAVGNEKILVHS